MSAIMMRVLVVLEDFMLTRPQENEYMKWIVPQLDLIVSQTSFIQMVLEGQVGGIMEMEVIRLIGIQVLRPT